MNEESRYMMEDFRLGTHADGTSKVCLTRLIFFHLIIIKNVFRDGQRTNLQCRDEMLIPAEKN